MFSSLIPLFANATKLSSGLCFGMNIFPSLKAIVKVCNAFHLAFIFDLFLRTLREVIKIAHLVWEVMKLINQHSEVGHEYKQFINGTFIFV